MSDLEGERVCESEANKHETQKRSTRRASLLPTYLVVEWQNLCVVSPTRTWLQIGPAAGVARRKQGARERASVRREPSVVLLQCALRRAGQQSPLLIIYGGA
jgi:hypothetical protein